MGRESHRMLKLLGGNDAIEYGECDHEWTKADIFTKFFEPWKEHIWT